jgi:hypothetical protein
MFEHLTVRIIEQLSPNAIILSCAYCSGSGSHGSPPCPVCHGAGEIGIVGEAISPLRTCRRCDGRGSVGTPACGYCGGAGCVPAAGKGQLVVAADLKLEFRRAAAAADLERKNAAIKLQIQQATNTTPRIKGAYAPGDSYGVYADIKALILAAKASIFIVDNYLIVDIFDLYVSRAAPSIGIRVLTKTASDPVRVVAAKFAKAGQFELRTTNQTHDRHIFVDEEAWALGQSIKEAAESKPTYLVQLTERALFKVWYEGIWSTATSVVKS